MRALVTGANGFTGSHLVRALLQRGDGVVGLVRQHSDLSRLADCKFRLCNGTITDRDRLHSIIKQEQINTVFHTAAYVELGIVDEKQMELTNVQGTRVVMDVAQQLGVSKIVYCSTIGIYGDTQGKVVDETFTRTQTDFSSAYDRTKYQAQQIVDQFAAQGLPVVSIMPSGIFGHDDPHFGPVMKQFLKGRLKLWVGGDRITGIVHVDDLVQAMILAAEKGKPGEHYIISAADLPTKRMFEILSQQTGISIPREAPKLLVRLLASILDPIGRSLQWQPPLSRERVHYIYDRCVRVDATKARKELSWQPRSVEDTLQGIVSQMQSHS